MEQIKNEISGFLTHVRETFCYLDSRNVTTFSTSRSKSFVWHCQTVRPETNLPVAACGIPSSRVACCSEPWSARTLCWTLGFSLCGHLIAMPEAAIDKDCLAARPKHDVRSAGQVFAMKGVTIAESMESLPNRQFGAGIRRLHRRHNLAANVWRDAIHTIIIASFRKSKNPGVSTGA